MAAKNSEEPTTKAGARYLSRNNNTLSQSTQQEKQDEEKEPSVKMSHYHRNRRYSPKREKPERQSVNITNLNPDQVAPLNVVGTNKKTNARYAIDRDRSLPELKPTKSQKNGILKSHRNNNTNNEASAPPPKERTLAGSIGITGS